MKTLVFSVLLLFCSSALLAQKQESKATTPLLTAIETAASGLPDIPASLGIPAPQPKTCTANQTCPVTGCLIACMGDVTCTVGSNSVTCDGNTTSCPYPSCVPPATCVDPCSYCQCRAAGGGSHFCVVSFCWDS
ncbi:MAG TPA: hypothetical protein VH394_02705 [Thermoanaerobaculia bacterium]|nr:hypothetical protein [Thermoanaerobaculia bacterium]